MGIQLIYLLSLLILGILASISFRITRKSESYQKVRIKKNRYDRFIDFVKTKVDEREIGELLKQSGFKFSAVQYQISRYVLVTVWLIIINFFYQIKGEDYPVAETFILVVIFLISSPKQYVFGKRTPFKIVIDVLTQNYRNKKNIEIFRAFSQLKNIVITRKNNPIGSDFILEQLRNFSRLTRPVFNRMIALWTINRKEEACDYFGQAIGTKEAADLANIFRKFDDLNPHELLNQIVLLQESVRKERETKKLKSNENKGNLVYFLVIITSSIIMINFVIVVYVLETLQQLKFIQ